MTDDDQTPTPEPTPPADALDQPERSKVPPEVLEGLMRVWQSAFVSGYVSAVATSMERAGIPAAARAPMLTEIERQSWLVVGTMVNDPLHRHQLVENIEQAYTSRRIGPSGVLRQMHVHDPGCSCRGHPDADPQAPR